MAGYSSSNNRHGGYTPLFSALALLLSTILLVACPDDNNGGDSDNGGSDDTPALSTAVTDVTITAVTPTALTLNWTNPADSDGFQGVLITAEPAGGILATPQQQAASATTAEITDLNPLTTYSFTLTSTYTDERKNNAVPAQPTMTATSANLPIDADGDGLVDITSLERLNNIRYNLDLGDGRYKSSTADGGVQCGTTQDVPCTGYELIISLDFANPNHYESGALNAAWRPNSMANNSGTILPQTMADTGTNNGWEPIGTNSNAFNSRLEGNGHTISNLYIRRSGDVGLFGGTGSASVIRSVGVAAVQLYGSGAADADIGALAGGSRGIIVASYASGAIAGSGNNNTLGGLVGTSRGGSSATVASYAAVSISHSGGHSNNIIGGLIGFADIGSFVIIASYTNAVIDGNGDIGGLFGQGHGDAIIRATYAGGMLRGGSGADIIGGLVALGSNVTVVASYATATVDGGEGSDTVGAFGGFSTIATVSYGFGSVTGGVANTIGAPTTSIPTAADITVDTAGTQWNDATEFTLDAWDFGNSTQAPVLRYADYDGPDNDAYGCGNGSTATIVIPNIIATPTGPMTITCGTTLLPEQGR